MRSLPVSVRSLPRCLRQLIGPLLPGLVRLEATGKSAEHHALYTQSLQGCSCSWLQLSYCSHSLHIHLYRCGRATEYGRYSTGPLFVILGGVLFSALANVPYSYLFSSGRTKTVAYLHLAELVPYLVGAAVMTSKFGAVGAAYVWSARAAVDSIACFAGAALGRTALVTAPDAAPSGSSYSSHVWAGPCRSSNSGAQSGRQDRLRCGTCRVLHAVLAWRVVLTAKERSGLLALLSEAVPATCRHSNAYPAAFKVLPNR